MKIILLNQTKTNKCECYTRLSPCVTLLAFLCLEHSLEIPLCLFDFIMGFKLVQRANILLIPKLHAKDNQWWQELVALQLWPRDQIAVFRGTVQFASLKVVYWVRSMLVIFFNLHRVVHLEFITQGHTVITESYCNVPRLLRENIEHKRPKLCCMPSCASQAFMAKPPCLLARFVFHHEIKLDTQVVKKQHKWRRSSAAFYKVKVVA